MKGITVFIIALSVFFGTVVLAAETTYVSSTCDIICVASDGKTNYFQNGVLLKDVTPQPKGFFEETVDGVFIWWMRLWWSPYYPAIIKGM